MQTCLYRMKIWKNTKILDDLLDSSTLTNNKTESEVVVLGSESINLNDSTLRAYIRESILKFKKSKL